VDILLLGGGRKTDQKRLNKGYRVPKASVECLALRGLGRRPGHVTC
jgi:hypothetical protein